MGCTQPLVFSVLGSVFCGAEGRAAPLGPLPSCVLCSVFCFLCSAFCVLCFVFWVLWVLGSGFCGCWSLFLTWRGRPSGVEPPARGGTVGTRCGHGRSLEPTSANPPARPRRRPSAAGTRRAQCSSRLPPCSPAPPSSSSAPPAASAAGGRGECWTWVGAWAGVRRALPFTDRLARIL